MDVVFNDLEKKKGSLWRQQFETAHLGYCQFEILSL
jgi:hypothetical protein